MNQNNGTCCEPGVPHGIEKKLEIAGVHQHHKEDNQGDRPKIADVPTACHVSARIARKIEAEPFAHGGVMDPCELPQNRNVGPGVHTIDETDSFILLCCALKNLHGLSPAANVISSPLQAFFEFPSLPSADSSTMPFQSKEVLGNQTLRCMTSSNLKTSCQPEITLMSFCKLPLLGCILGMRSCQREKSYFVLRIEEMS
jgi:hypothetical protein